MIEVECKFTVVLIPIDELGLRLGELPKDQKMVVSCQAGQRAYFACRLLPQHGFRVRNRSGACRTWNAAVERGGALTRTIPSNQ